jgi:hypothetical protein
VLPRLTVAGVPGCGCGVVLLAGAAGLLLAIWCPLGVVAPPHAVPPAHRAWRVPLGNVLLRNNLRLGHLGTVFGYVAPAATPCGGNATAHTLTPCRVST